MPAPNASRSLADLTSIGVGGAAGRLVPVSSVEEITTALADQPGPDQPGPDDPGSLLVLGGGSNVVISDEGFAGTVLLVSGGLIETAPRPGGTQVELTVDAGVSWDELVATTVELGCGGIEMMSGVPGSVGAAPMQNIGAYGQQVADVIEAVEVIDRRSLERHHLSAADCGFAFRFSRFKGDLMNRFVVARVRFVLPTAEASPPQPSTYVDIEKHFEREGGSPVDLAARRRAVLTTRAAKSMLLDPTDPNSRSVGSFFINPTVPIDLARDLAERFATMNLRVHYLEGTGRGADPEHQRIPAAHVLRYTGFNPGDSWGPVKLSDKHVLAMVARPGATATDVWQVGNHIRERVEAATGVALAYESTFVGPFPEYRAERFAEQYHFEPAPAIEPAWLTSYR